MLIMAEDFDSGRIAASAQVVFDAVKAKLAFGSEVFWARASIGEEVLHLRLETYQVTRRFGKRGIV